MKSQNTITVKDLVLVGGGHAHVQVLRSFGMNPMPGVRVTLICREAAASYSGMLPGLIAGHYAFDDVHIDLRPLARFAGAQFLHDEVTGFDLDAKRILCRDRPPVVYDLMSINTGSTPTTTGVPGAAEHALPVKPIDDFLTQFEDIATEAASAGNRPRIGVVGGGAGGVELLLAVQHRLAQAPGDNRPQFHLITDAPDILVTHNRRVRSRFHRVLSERGVQIHVNHKAERLEEKDGRKLLICRPGGMLTWRRGS